MAKTIKEQRLRWVKPIAEKRIKLVDVARACPYGKSKQRKKQAKKGKERTRITIRVRSFNSRGRF